MKVFKRMWVQGYNPELITQLKEFFEKQGYIFIARYYNKNNQHYLIIKNR